MVQFVSTSSASAPHGADGCRAKGDGITVGLDQSCQGLDLIKDPFQFSSSKTVIVNNLHLEKCPGMSGVNTGTRFASSREIILQGHISILSSILIIAMCYQGNSDMGTFSQGF